MPKNHAHHSCCFALFFSLLFMFSFPVHAASFNCAKAATAPEKMICGSATLGALDEKLAAAYKALGHQLVDTTALTMDQRQWLKTKRDACKDAACMENEIKARMSVLAGWNEDDVPGDSIYGNYVVTHEVDIVNGNAVDKTSVDDCLVIKKSAQNKAVVDFSINLVQSNAHLCNIDGSAGLGNVSQNVYQNVYQYLPRKGGEEELAKCKLKLIVKRHTIRLDDADGACREYSCGARAGFHQVEFLRSKKVVKSCAVVN